MRAARRIAICTLTALLAAVGAFAESTINCPPGQIDMLDWYTLDSDLRSSHYLTGSHPMITRVDGDKFWHTKNLAGDTWDIYLYDGSFIYQWATERVWGDPNDYKPFTPHKLMSFAPRCATPGYPGTVLTHWDSTYQIVENCSVTETHSLLRVVVSLWGPYQASQPGLESWRQPIGGSVPNNSEVYTISYRYGCDNNYNNCFAKEEFILSQRYGWVRWYYFLLEGGQYVLQASSDFNTLVPGNTTPNFACGEPPL